DRLLEFVRVELAVAVQVEGLHPLLEVDVILVRLHRVPDEERPQPGRLGVPPGEGEAVRDLREGGRGALRVLWRGGAIRSGVALSSPGEIEDEHLRDEVDEIRYDG